MKSCSLVGGFRRFAENMFLSNVDNYPKDFSRCTVVPHDTTGLRPFRKWLYRERSYHGICFSVDLHVMNEDTFQNK
jgi:hypothetical protein